MRALATALGAVLGIIYNRDHEGVESKAEGQRRGAEEGCSLGRSLGHGLSHFNLFIMEQSNAEGRSLARGFRRNPGAELGTERLQRSLAIASVFPI